jgi:hypothetical protein
MMMFCSILFQKLVLHEDFNQWSKIANVFTLHHLTNSLKHYYLNCGPALQLILHVVEHNVNLVNQIFGIHSHERNSILVVKVVLPIHAGK